LFEAMGRRLDVSFRDEAFPPAVALADLEERLRGRELVWVPASMLLSGDPRQRTPLFCDINPSDVRQGEIGDCWLIAAISCIANFPEEVEELFVDEGGSPSVRAASDGRYTLRLFDHRQDAFINIVIDERVPALVPTRGCYYPGWQHLQAGLPIFAKPSSVEIWPLLVEKAVAKLFGGFAGLEGGHECSAFRAFTGCTRQEHWRRRGADGSSWERGLLQDGELGILINISMPIMYKLGILTNSHILINSIYFYRILKGYF